MISKTKQLFLGFGLAFAILLLSVQNAWAFELEELSRSNAEVGDVITITTDLFTTFNADSSIDVRFFQDDSLASTVPKLDVIPNTAIDLRVPDIAEGEYEIEVEIEDETSENRISPFQVVAARPFNFNVLSGNLPSEATPADTAFKDIDFGDVDNDGDLDIYSFNSKANDFVDRLLINQGGDQGGTAGEYLVGSLPSIPGEEFGRTYDGDIVDLDGDGLRDIIRSDQDGIHLLMNTGGGTFDNRPDLLPSNDAISTGMGSGVPDFNGIGNIYFDGVDAADVDGDGDLDLLFANYTGGGANLLLLNQLSGSAGEFVIANRNGDVFETLEADDTHGVAFGDADGDGDPDIFLTNVVAGEPNRLLINQGTFSGMYVDETATRLPAGSVNTGQSVDVLFSDFDNDGDQDILFVNRNASNSIPNNLFWNDGTGNFTDLGSPNYPDLPANGSTYDIVISDVDFDGDLDIIESTGESNTKNNNDRVLINRGGRDGNLLFTVKSMPYLPTPQHRLGIDVGDIDFDLDLDMIAGGFNSDGVTLYENDLFNPDSEDFDYVILIDRTASMVSGGKDFLTPVKNIAQTILMQKRPDDQVGIVTYEYTGSTPDPQADEPSRDVFKAETLLTLEESEDITPEALQAIVEGIEAGTCGSAGPGFGCTSIGQAIRKGIGDIKPNTNPDRIKVLVVLTDGEQNLPPAPADVVANFPANVRVYAIALGTETDNQMLSDISSLGSGFHQSLDSLNLADIFQNIESDATEKPIIPTQVLGRTSQPITADAFSEPTVIQFDDSILKDGQSIQNEFLEQGVRVFNDGRSAIPRIFGPNRRGGLPTVSEPNTLTNTSNPEEGEDAPLSLLFNELQQKVGMFVGNGRGQTQAILSAYDQENNLIGQSFAPVPRETEQFIGIESSAGDIAKVQLKYEPEIIVSLAGISDVPIAQINGGQFQASEQIDNLIFEPALTDAATDQTFFVDAQDKQIRVTLSWQNQEAVPTLQLIDPLGQTIVPDSDPTVQIESGDVFEIFDIKGPLVGTWTARTTVSSGERTFLSVVASSGLKMSLQADSRQYFPGETMGLTAVIVKTVDGELEGIPGANLQVTVQQPNGAIVQLPNSAIFDQGNGTYNIAFNGVEQEGTYNFHVLATLDPGTDQSLSRVRIASTVASALDPTGICDRQSQLTVEPQDLVADGTSEANITLDLRNCQGDPVEPVNQPQISFTTDAGTLVGEPQQVGPGQFVQTLVAPTKMGPATIAALTGNAKLDPRAMVNFVPGPVDPNISRVDVIVSEGFARADGNSKVIILVTTLDANGNRLDAGQDVQIDFKGPMLGDWLGPVRDLGDGSYERILRSRLETGETSFQASVNGIELAKMPVLIFSVDGEDIRDSDGDGVTNDKDKCPFTFKCVFFIEAEDLNLHKYQVEDRSVASGGRMIRLSEYTGTASMTFTGPSGFYTVTIGYFDESDGKALLRLKVNNKIVDNWRLDQVLAPKGVVPIEKNFTQRTIGGVKLNKGDVLTIEGFRNRKEYARVDFIQLSPVGDH